MSTAICRYGNFELLPGDSIVSDALLWYGEWAENELELLRRFISPGDVVADIGSFIGTHAVALADAVGAMGHVHAFEPRRETFDILRRNIDRNSEGRVTAHNVGVSDKPSTIRLGPINSETQNLGGLSLIDQGEGYEVSVITIDALSLPRLDLMKIDVEGMEAKVINGARDTIARCRPVIFAECNTVQGAAETLHAIAELNYSALGSIYPAFNEDNFNRATDNFYGASAECAIVLIPQERIATLPLQDMVQINTLEDVVALLLQKPQYLPEILPDAPRVPAVVRHPNPQISHRRASLGRLHLIAPFFQNEHLVSSFMAGLRASQRELEQLGVEVWLYNDSPGHPGLAEALTSAVKEGLGDVPLNVVENPSNLGFIGTCNRAFSGAVAAGADVFLLNSDTQLTSGALSEILAVAYTDPMFGFVSPRSNNATLASLPHSAIDADLAPDIAYARFLSIAPRLPRYSLVPTAVGFAMWIRGSLLAEFGGFDETFGQGYNEENDLILRANRAGYRAVLANHAFVWHQGEQSFSRTQQQRDRREARNGAILRKRYPEYEPLLRRYFNSPEYRAEALLGQLEPVSGKRLIAFDFSSFAAAHNGTFESGMKLLEAALATWPDDIEIAVIASEASWDFHHMGELPDVRRIAPEDLNARAAAVIRIGQPFDQQALKRLFNTAPVIGVFMLDTIAADCGYLSLDFDDSIWRFVFANTSVLFTNSEFTLSQIKNRYALGEHVRPVVSRHSLDVSEYRVKEFCGNEDGLAAQHILVIGNHYAHKFVRETADALAMALPEERIIAVGYPESRKHAANIVPKRAGSIDQQTFARFYREARVVVFPSHYEGFGFPMLHALAWQRPVFVRDSVLNEELSAHIRESANIHRYRTTQELAAALLQPPTWSTEQRDGETHGWERSAMEVFTSMSLAMHEIHSTHVVKALRNLSSNEHGTIDKLARSVAKLIDRMLSISAIREIVRIVRRRST